MAVEMACSIDLVYFHFVWYSSQFYYQSNQWRFVANLIDINQFNLFFNINKTLKISGWVADSLSEIEMIERFTQSIFFYLAQKS